MGMENPITSGGYPGDYEPMQAWLIHTLREAKESTQPTDNFKPGAGLFSSVRNLARSLYRKINPIPSEIIVSGADWEELNRHILRAGISHYRGDCAELAHGEARARDILRETGLSRIGGLTRDERNKILDFDFNPEFADRVNWAVSDDGEEVIFKVSSAD